MISGSKARFFVVLFIKNRSQVPGKKKEALRVDVSKAEMWCLGFQKLRTLVGELRYSLEITAMKMRIYFTLVLTLLVGSCSGLQVQDYKKVFEEQGQPPVLIDYYAPAVIRPGTTWKIYLEAKDTDGDMVYMATMLYQTGFGYYATDYTRLTGKERKKFTGYVALRTPSEASLTQDKFTMEVLIRDRQRNSSEIIKLPLSFGQVEQEKIPDKWEAVAKNRLGVVVTGIQSMQQITE
jgi:hypothetical protein